MCGTYFELSKCKLPCCIHSQTCESHSNMFGAVKNAKKVYKKGWGGEGKGRKRRQGNGWEKETISLTQVFHAALKALIPAH